MIYKYKYVPKAYRTKEKPRHYILMPSASNEMAFEYMADADTFEDIEDAVEWVLINRDIYHISPTRYYKVDVRKTPKGTYQLYVSIKDSMFKRALYEYFYMTIDGYDDMFGIGDVYDYN